MDDAIRSALAVDRNSTARARTVDISTTGAKTGLPRRIEIWFYRVDGTVYLSGLPGRRGWFVNLKVHPEFTFHLKNEVKADLAAIGRAITDETQRRRVFTAIVDDLNQSHNPARISQPTSVADWLAGSPLVEVSFID